MWIMLNLFNNLLTRWVKFEALSESSELWKNWSLKILLSI